MVVDPLAPQASSKSWVLAFVGFPAALGVSSGAVVVAIVFQDFPESQQ